MDSGGTFYHAGRAGAPAALTTGTEIPIMMGANRPGGGAKGLRVVAGRWRGRTLRAPRGLDVRPTTDRVREAIFSILGDRVVGTKVLDLFAGTGAMAIEALSRGASGAVLVESSSRAAAAIEGNLASLGASSAVCLSMDYRKALRQLAPRGERFSLVFIDPPYGGGLIDSAAEALERAGVLRPGALVVAESAARDPKERAPARWVQESERRYGDTRVAFYEVRPGPGNPESDAVKEG
jgi:16S rRNA (guanine966-N2)-methyltransferase